MLLTAPAQQELDLVFVGRVLDLGRLDTLLLELLDLVGEDVLHKVTLQCFVCRVDKPGISRACAKHKARAGDGCMFVRNRMC